MTLLHRIISCCGVDLLHMLRNSFISIINHCHIYVYIYNPFQACPVLSKPNISPALLSDAAPVMGEVLARQGCVVAPQFSVSYVPQSRPTWSSHNQDGPQVINWNDHPKTDQINNGNYPKLCLPSIEVNYLDINWYWWPLFKHTRYEALAPFLHIQ